MAEDLLNQPGIAQLEILWHQPQPRGIPHLRRELRVLNRHFNLLFCSWQARSFLANMYGDVCWKFSGCPCVLSDDRTVYPGDVEYPTGLLPKS